MIPVLALIGGLLLGAVPEPVTNLSVLPSLGRTEVVIEVMGDIQFRDFTMEGPNRLVVDLLGARTALSGESFPAVDRGGISSVRVTQYSEDIVRVVLELQDLADYTISQGDGYLRVSFPNDGSLFDPWAANSVERAAGTSPTAPTRAEVRAPPPVARDLGPRTSTLPSGTRFGIQAVQQATPITVTFKQAAVEDVLFTFAEFSGRSIVPGANVSGLINADIRAQPWDIALQTILSSQGWAARELESGIIIVDNLENLAQREGIEQLVTRTFRISYSQASDLLQPVESLLTERGSAQSSQAANIIVVMDVPRVLDDVEALLNELDRRTPQISIAAKIIFVDRTDLLEYGITYDLKDSQGNQINLLTPGGIDVDGNGTIDADEIVEQGTNVVTLGGNSVAALGNANAKVINPSIQFLTSLVMGRYSLISFIEALESMNLSEIQATPTVQVMDNQEARVLVGERTPLRVVDASAGGAVGGQQPTATVDIQETGISLTVTPHVTAGDLVLLDLQAERSAAVLAESDAGFIFRTQEAQTKVLVRDGETVVIAGLTATETSEVRTGIPLLMDIPFLGALFRTTRHQTQQRDLMILVTPYIERDAR